MKFQAGHSSDSAGTTPTESFVDFAGPSSPERAELERLAAATIEEMAAAWHDGVQTPAERWFERHPDLAADPETAVRIVFEEICLREECGQRVESSEIFARFPQWRHALEIVLDCHRLLQSESAAPVFPEAGQQLGELQLLRELGRGGQGRVFLATQPSLSDRPLVVKLTPRSGDEHLSLARLQHTHIAPLYLVQEFPDEQLRTLCMPYLGGASWSHVLQILKAHPLAELSGRHIVEALDAAQDEPRTGGSVGPALGFLARATYVEAVCWIGSCLADALHYAHQRGLVHLDIKPSNVLLAGDGQPMLLDFHLAHEVVPAGSQPIDRLGGTRGYMSREQEACAAAVRDGRRLEVALDGRSDIYSLGVMLYESLAGGLPPSDESAAQRALRQANSDVSRGLEDILLKCLAQHSAARYSDAGQLAADLRRHLAALPLQGVPNRSLQERWHKWRRRQPHALIVSAAGCVALAVILAAALWFHADRTSAARVAIAQAQQHFASRDFAAAIERAETGRAAIRFFPWHADLQQALKTQLSLATRAQLGDALHALVEKLRFADSVQNAPQAQLRSLESGCRKIWQVRDQIAALEGSAASADTETQLRKDLLDLTLLWSRLRLRLAAEDQLEQERRAVLRILDEVQAQWGSSAVLELSRREYRNALGEGEPPLATASLPAARTAWEHYLVGRFMLQSENLAQAQMEFERAIQLEPNSFWPNFYLTLCAYRLADFETALRAACVCVALAPHSTECYYNRALCYQADGHFEQSFDDFTRALELDPSSSAATLHRGMLLIEMRRFPEALADLRNALDRGASPEAVYYQMAVVHLAEQDRAAALTCLDRALEHDPAHSPALSLRRRLHPAEQ